MAYHFNFNSGQQLWVQQQGEQTAITLSVGSVSQQQQQQTLLTTGLWQASPVLLQTAVGLVLKIEGARGVTYVQIQANGLQLLAAAATAHLGEVNLVAGQEMPDAHGDGNFELQPMTPIQPMTPMAPMKMGNMSMQMTPMRMQMGEMTLEMSSSSSQKHTTQSETASTTRRFCTQCGHGVAPSDRFCAHCGHQLSG